MSEDMTLWTAVGKVQAEVKNLLPGATAQVGQRQYRYVTLDRVLDELRPLLAKHGLTVSFIPVADGVEVVLAGHGECERWVVPWLASSLTPQVRGSEMTYVRRYVLCGIFGITAEDDDDAQAAEQAASKAQALAQQSAPVINKAVAEARAEDAERKAAVSALYAACRKAGIPTQGEAGRQAVRKAAADALGIEVGSVSQLTTEDILEAATRIATDVNYFED